MTAGRPQKEIDWDKVDTLCKIQCTGEEIAAVLQVSYDTLNRAFKRDILPALDAEYEAEDHDPDDDERPDRIKKFADYLKQKRSGGKASLRRMQWTAAQGGNPTMLVWLGKNMLNQTDKTDITSGGEKVANEWHMHPVTTQKDADGED